MAVDAGRIKGIVFDLDDTLCAYWDACKIGLRRAFEQEGPSHVPVEQAVREWAVAFREFAPSLKHTGWYEGYLREGEPTRTEQMRRTLGRMGIEDDEHAMRLSQAYLVERDRALSLFPDAIEVLDALQSRYQLGLMTNGPADIQRMEIATLGIEHYFAPILIEGELGEGKPFASVFRRAEDVMQLGADQMLMVGNSYGHDVRAALDNGWQAVWVRRPSDVPPSAGDAETVESRPPDGPEPGAVIGELRELLPLLNLPAS